MGLVSQSIKNIKGGISQQPDILRYPNQGQQQINGLSSESAGLQKRPPTLFIKRLGERGLLGDRPLVHLINRDAEEQYYVCFKPDAVMIYDLAGRNYPVYNFNGYSNSASPRDDLRIITVADYTFVVNRRSVVQMSNSLTHAGYPRLNARAIINVRGGQYGRTLSVSINGDGSGSTPQASIKMPTGSQEKVPEGQPYAGMNQVDMTDATWIAGELANQLTQAMGPAGWSFQAGAGWILISAPANDNVRNITTKDGYADQLLSGFIYQVQTFNKLPANAPNGYLVEVTGESARSGDNYWVRYDGTAKVWMETAKPGIISGLDPATMPHAIVRQADGNFYWTQLSWDLRNAGDDQTNPMPSFVDSTINDVFFFRNRLGFLSGENVVLSRTARYFNFFPSSVSAINDDDPIDVAISHNRISILRYAVPFSEQLLLWSDQAQFVLSSNGILSSKNIELNLTTEFDVSDGARPFGIGRGVYFASPRASYTSLKRYYAVQDVSSVKSAEDVSAHVPTYIPNKVFSIHGSGTENFVSLLSDGDPTKLFIYKFLYIQEELVQQSFSHWTFGIDTRILAASSIGSYMFLILERAEGMFLERIDFTQNTKDLPSFEPYRAYMDNKRSATIGGYNIDTNTSFIDLFEVYGGSASDVTAFHVLDSKGLLQTFEGPWGNDYRIYFQGNRNGESVVVGRQYDFIYEFSKLLIKQTAGDGSSNTEDIGRLQLRRAWVNYEESGSFEVNVNNGSTQYVYVMSGKLGVDFNLGQLPIGTGQFKFPVTGDARRQAITITSSTPNPLNLIGCGWEGNYIRRSAGI